MVMVVLTAKSCHVKAGGLQFATRPMGIPEVAEIIILNPVDLLAPLYNSRLWRLIVALVEVTRPLWLGLGISSTDSRPPTYTMSPSAGFWKTQHSHIKH